MVRLKARERERIPSFIKRTFYLQLTCSHQGKDVTSLAVVSTVAAISLHIVLFNATKTRKINWEDTSALLAISQLMAVTAARSSSTQSVTFVLMQLGWCQTFGSIIIKWESRQKGSVTQSGCSAASTECQVSINGVWPHSKRQNIRSGWVGIPAPSAGCFVCVAMQLKLTLDFTLCHCCCDPALCAVEARQESLMRNVASRHLGSCQVVTSRSRQRLSTLWLRWWEGLTRWCYNAP